MGHDMHYQLIVGYERFLVDGLWVSWMLACEMELILPKQLDREVWLRMNSQERETYQQVVLHDLGKGGKFHGSGNLADAPKRSVALY